MVNEPTADSAAGAVPESASDPSLADIDRDSLHILPLSIIPLQTKGLRRARMIKNVRLRSVVELFRDEQAGSGQLDIEDLGAEFGWPPEEIHPDLVVLRKLAGLPSYDVYSLRVLLRDHGIKVNDHDALRLSPTKNRELTQYMTQFTRPLILQIYGSGDIAIKDFGDVIALFRDPDVSRAREKLRIMAQKLEIRVEEVPKFLEDYGDIFLSLAYYRQCLDQIEGTISEFLESLGDLRKNFQLRTDTNLMRTCDMIEATINGLMAAITGRFENFDRSTKDMWNEITAARFRKVEALITTYHTTIGGVLCALSVKMNAWNTLFPSRSVGGPIRRSEFIMGEMKQGIENIKQVEDSAPMLSALD